MILPPQDAEIVDPPFPGVTASIEPPDPGVAWIVVDPPNPNVASIEPPDPLAHAPGLVLAIAVAALRR
ncbi:hypothetical protein [Sorangium sp. So ce1000]|uniref:hypothetical protein n=1 Tax=Sorangium sp. So ce1000 TaxID=3133325 RepID=UPI003F5EA51C